MTRAAVNFLLDSLLLIAFCVVLAATAIVQFVFPEGTRAAGWSLWGLGFNGWVRVVSASVATLALGVLIHLILHWTWVCGFVTNRLGNALGRVMKSNESTRTLYGVGTLIAVITGLAMIYTAAAFMVHQPPQ